MVFSRPEYWSGLPFPSPGDLPDPGMELGSLALAGGFFITWVTIAPPLKKGGIYVSQGQGVFVLLTNVFQTSNYWCNCIWGKCQMLWGKKRKWTEERHGKKANWEAVECFEVIFTLLKRVKRSSRLSERKKETQFQGNIFPAHSYCLTLRV